MCRTVPLHYVLSCGVVCCAAVLWASAAFTSTPVVADEPHPNPSGKTMLNQLATLKPSPDLTPGQVVRIQVGALAHNDQPTKDAGIAIVYSFASPANRSNTGPLPRFTQMIRGGYGVMLNHADAQFGPVESDGSQAAINVVLFTKSGEQAGFRFFLSKQGDGPYKGCWMTDAVMPIEINTI